MWVLGLWDFGLHLCFFAADVIQQVSVCSRMYTSLGNGSLLENGRLSNPDWDWIVAQEGEI